MSYCKTNDFEAFSALAGQVLEEGVFHPSIFCFVIDVDFPTTPSTQLLFAVAFVPPLGPIIVGYRAVNSSSLVLGRASLCVAKRSTLAARIPGRGNGKCHTNSANMHVCCPGPAREGLFGSQKSTPSLQHLRRQPAAVQRLCNEILAYVLK